VRSWWCNACSAALTSGFFVLTLSIDLLGTETSRPTLRLTVEQITALGLRVWDNESNRRYEGLTTWNEGERFASLGIGHFIWYPMGSEERFEESFPALILFLKQRSEPVPEWLMDENVVCPWRTREMFLAQFNSSRMRQLREFLAATVPAQSEFMVGRLMASLPKMLNNAPIERRHLIERQFEGLITTPRGLFALLDYVNFKGEGINQSERYRGEGWGLLQVLDAMPEDSLGDPLNHFIQSASMVLTRRVRNSPPARDEKRWLKGWIVRVQSYREKLD